MNLSRIHVRNYRSIREERISCNSLTALVGRNGAGKSAFLNALEVFYDASAKMTSDDYYAADATQEIEIALTFNELTDEETEFFSSYIDNATLTVAKVFESQSEGKPGSYHGMRMQSPVFHDIRSAGGKRDAINKYRELRASGRYTVLPSVRSSDEALVALAEWESRNPNDCVRMRDDGQFFGFTGVGQGYLGRHTRFIKIPAVRDAAEDAIEKRGSCVTEIMDLVVRSAISTRTEIADFIVNTQSKYQELLDPSNLTELSSLETQLTSTLAQYVPDASVTLMWTDFAEIQVPMPDTEIRLSEDGYESAVEQSGHGLQRAFILTMLQHLAAARKVESVGDEHVVEEENTVEQKPSLPNLVLAIEEPELYQHPSRQRHMATLLLKLAQGSVPGVANRTQVLYTTHAPLFVGLDRFDQIRIIRKITNNGETPKVTTAKSVLLESVANKLWSLGGNRGERHTPATLRPRLQALMTPWMNEGFFAEVVVLVEGESDRAVILAVANSLSHDLESINICVIPCMGKNNIDRPALVFKGFGIQTYMVWDSDDELDSEINTRLLNIAESSDTNELIGVWDTYTCVEGNLEDNLRSGISPDVFDDLLGRACEEYEIKRPDAKKNPLVLQKVIENADAEGFSCRTMNKLVERIVNMQQDTI